MLQVFSLFILLKELSCSKLKMCFLFKLLKYLFIYFLLCQVLNVACRIFDLCCGMCEFLVAACELLIMACGI